MNRKRVLTVVFLAFCTFVSGQENSWSLTKCFETALQNNIEIKIRQLEIKRTQKSQNSVLNRMLPTVSLYGEQRYSFGSTIDPSTNGRVSSNIQNDNFYINTRTNLIDFSAFVNAKKDKISIEIAKAEKEVIENEYKLQLLDSYYQTLYTQELIKIQKEQLKQASFNLDRISKEVAIGRKPQSDLYDMQLSFSEEENSYLETQQLYGIQKMQLFQLINVSNVATDAVTLEIYFDENTADTIKKTNSNPKIKLAEFQYQNSLKSIHLERANNLPVLSAYYGYSTFYYKNIKEGSDFSDSFSTQLSDNKNQEVGMQLMIPIFNGFRNNKKIIASKIESEKVKLVIDQEKQELDKQVALEEQNKKNCLQLQHKLMEKQKYAKASLATMQAKFISGKVEAILYSSVKNQSLSADYEVLKNSLQLQYVDLRINLLKNDNF
ncbi:TolC family protein [Flavobacterium gawalongense]|uniref:TolC family protein n=1 Tax=Flavobacterium gawalongense TaxID=2594432 RepID=A0A553BET9_9FLAO|nr:TolC family protein [Flavobacterium gawalongense]TRW99081.1 TolC family protein [Flavobacterium gawalongense]TRX03797.1 TolC family protein [Flavobacterium gawalongense]TRX06722.1 TolC family protein [Flavobacterium gawalongense]TRX07581.1 TolC family protein [Flavobacterium gawalongense]TRX23410.1 TolC family protein [Flavobacterium gawalongense]